MTVPVLYDGPWYERNGLFGHSVFPAIEGTLDSLGRHGSRAAMAFGVEFYNAEGICIFHTAANTIFKVTLQDDEAPKSMSGS